jgi:hypothetical protein
MIVTWPIPLISPFQGLFEGWPASQGFHPWLLYCAPFGAFMQKISSKRYFLE